jgi:hypothetical protein
MVNIFFEGYQFKKIIKIIEKQLNKQNKMKKPVIPAKAGIPFIHCNKEIPAFAGMTPVFLVITKNLLIHLKKFNLKYLITTL